MFSLTRSASSLKNFFFIIFCIIASQGAVQAATPHTQAADPALVSYLKNKGTKAGQNDLERIRSQGLSASSANVKLLREALATRSSDEEQALLIANLGSLYDRKNASSQNTAIKRDLKNLAQSGKRIIARAAVFAVSRMGGDEDLKELLRKAKSNGHIDNDEYSGEIAHNIRFLPRERQLEFISLFKQSNSKYGIDVLTANLSAREFLSQYSADGLTEIDYFLEKNEPNFPFAIGDFGYSDAMRYTAWLQARALILDHQGRGTSSAFILRELSNPKLDPRKVIGYLSSPEAEPFLSQISHGRLNAILTRISTYSNSLPQNQVIHEAVSLILLRIDSLGKH